MMDENKKLDILKEKCRTAFFNIGAGKPESLGYAQVIVWIEDLQRDREVIGQNKDGSPIYGKLGG